MHHIKYVALLSQLQALASNEKHKKKLIFCTLDFYAFAKNEEM